MKNKSRLFIVIFALAFSNTFIFFATDNYASNNTSIALTSSGLLPANNAENVSLTDSLFIYFNKRVSAGNGSIHIYNAENNSNFQSIKASSENIIIRGSFVEIRHDEFLPNTKYYVFVDPDAFYETTNSASYFAGINRIFDWTFKTKNIQESEETKKINFTDIQDHWAKNFIELAVEREIVLGIGNGLFSPDTFVTRSQFIQMISNALKLPPSLPNTEKYVDVTERDWYFDAVMRMRSSGFLEHFEQDNFFPERPITREEIAVIIASIIHSQEEYDIESISETYDDFSDMNPLYLDSIQTVVQLEIITGITPNLFDPKGNATRAQAVTIIIRLLQD